MEQKQEFHSQIHVEQVFPSLKYSTPSDLDIKINNAIFAISHTLLESIRGFGKDKLNAFQAIQFFGTQTGFAY